MREDDPRQSPAEQYVRLLSKIRIHNDPGKGSIERIRSYLVASRMVEMLDGSVYFFSTSEGITVYTGESFMQGYTL